jgi:hypothetical protein
MKNKRIIYFLLPAVLIIWGLIIFRAVAFLNRNDRINYKKTSEGLKTQLTGNVDTFSLLLNYPDTFLLSTRAPSLDP